MVEKSLVLHVLNLAGDKEINQQVSAHALLRLTQIEKYLLGRLIVEDINQRAHYEYLREQLRSFRADPAAYKVPAAPAMPDGAPIGCDWE